ncbi:MAG: ATP-binding protein [Desulforhopalus sp.]|nr:ATP-binding protein [Desulforhopalus sp.]
MKRLFFATWVFLIASLLFVQFILGPIIGKIAKTHLDDSIAEYSRQLARGTFHMMELDLLRLPEDEWPNRIIQLAPHFGYNIVLLPIGELPLSKYQMDQLRDGIIAVAEDGELLYHRIGKSHMALRKGPFSVLEPDSGYFNLIIWLGITAIIGVLTFICVLPYWRQLRKISNAATAFGDGALDTRVEISKISTLALLAQAFNTMADRIQELISSHKELTNAVSHELRTPLSRLRFGLEMLETAEDQEKRRRYARGLRADVTELDELVSELLTFARFDREKPELQLSILSLEPFLRQVIAESIPEDHPVHCQLQYRINSASGNPCFEPKYMARAIGNLLQNALSYAEKDIEIVAERNGETCIIHIDDDGPGIPEADRVKVFEPFARLDASRSKASGGYGLGLAIVTRIMQWHNGQATAGNSPLGGARLTITWPGFSK